MEFNRNLILEMMDKLISLENQLSEMGGREAVAALKTPELETLYDKIYDLEDEILKQFDLPLIYNYRSQLHLLTNWEHDHLSYKKELIMLRLEKESKDFLLQN